ncbi:hypothetical protein J2S19_003924 [Metabacillus malikii]|uniref:Uncharacterized protein n=1 Tax=Metabacillus malikii TaxID=1504265 RepID=A0ABT9ZJX9_9BACI|nr:hypothetical protein [Metabacillus malikii]
MTKVYIQTCNIFLIISHRLNASLSLTESCHGNSYFFVLTMKNSSTNNGIQY